MTGRIRAELKKNGLITLGETRDMLNTTRKYVQALLEHLDSIGVTQREGDARKLRG
ncbi:MAG: SelB C-terminal domain-containing protein [Anaerolineales bacterium]|uniref:SelB domain-containing protein n=1 Tax=Candidatus Villigracilis proximus TaxID=3140683 RepID=UPI00313566F0|nr:SelB C-terminal domain-containing protein [Anaerolineales bacterium]